MPESRASDLHDLGTAAAYISGLTLDLRAFFDYYRNEIMLELKTKIRPETGRKNRQIRKTGLIPAVLYGKKVDNLLLSVKEGDFEKIYQAAGENTLIKLKIGGDKDKTDRNGERVVLIQDIARDSVSDKIIHIDFNQVKLDETIVVEIPLVFIGESKAVVRENGVLVKNISSLEVEALPQNLPHEIQVDISVLKTFNENVRIKDVKVPEGTQVKGNPEDVIATVVPPRTQEELEKLKEVPTESVEQVETEAKGKEKTEEKTPAEESPTEGKIEQKRNNS